MKLLSIKFEAALGTWRVDDDGNLVAIGTGTSPSREQDILLKQSPVHGVTYLQMTLAYLFHTAPSLSKHFQQ